MAKRDGVEIRYYSIIYNVIDDVKQALTGLLAPTLREKFLGNAQILQGVQHHQGRQGRGLQGDRRRRQARRESAAVARQRRHPRRHAQNPQAHQGRSARKCAKASNAAWRSRITTISTKATRSNASRWKRSRGNYKRRKSGEVFQLPVLFQGEVICSRYANFACMPNPSPRMPPKHFCKHAPRPKANPNWPCIQPMPTGWPMPLRYNSMK